MVTTDFYIRGAILIVLLVLSAVFSGSETAITGITISQIRKLKEEDESAADILISMKKRMNYILSTILIGNNLVNIAATSLVTEMTIKLLGGGNSLFVATAVMTVLVLIFGEITPKSYASQNPIRVAKRVYKPLKGLTFLMTPVVFILNKITSVVIRIIGGEVTTDTLVTEEDIRSLVDAGEEEGILQVEEKEMIQNIFDIDDLDVAEVMVPRIDIVALPKETTIRELVDSPVDFGFSRIPVYDESIDNIIGILYAKDIIPIALDETKITSEIAVSEIMREAHYVPETKKVNVLLKELQLKKIHMAIVLDEYGGTEGLVTIEDILEEIVGEIFDEYDSEVNLIRKVGQDRYVVQGDISLDEVNDNVGSDLPADDFDSIGGFIFSTLGRIPEEGDRVDYQNLEFKVLGMENRRVLELEMFVKEKIEEEDEKEN